MKYPYLAKKAAKKRNSKANFNKVCSLYIKADSWDEFELERTTAGLDKVARFAGLDRFRIYYFMMQYGNTLSRWACIVPISVLVALFILAMLTIPADANIADYVCAWFLITTVGSLITFALVRIVFFDCIVRSWICGKIHDIMLRDSYEDS